jgi:hypothetical protein
MPCQWNTVGSASSRYMTMNYWSTTERFYCLFHLPLDNDNKLDPNELSIQFNEAPAPGIGLRDFSGVAFPGHATHGMVATYRVDVEAVFSKLHVRQIRDPLPERRWW